MQGFHNCEFDGKASSSTTDYTQHFETTSIKEFPENKLHSPLEEDILKRECRPSEFPEQNY